MAVLEFRAVTITPPGLRGDAHGGFVAGGQFVVRARFDAEDAFRYEYRQYIKGSAFLTMGAFGPGAPSRANWRATHPQEDVGNRFEVPGGLRSGFREDGQRRGGRTEKFGYRNAMPAVRFGLEDQYVPDQKTGNQYRLRDTWGLRGNSRPRGLRVQLDITYKGSVIDRNDGDREVETRVWRCHLDDIIV